MRTLLAAFILALALGASLALAPRFAAPRQNAAVRSLPASFVPAQAEVHFSPKSSAQSAIIREIEAAKNRIAVQAFSFTSAPIISALKAAHERGVVVYVLLDKSNLTGKYSGASYLLNAGVPVGIDPKHAIAHNKLMILDPGTPDATIITGSFNFTKAAQESNAENVLILKNCPELVKSYLDNWRQHGEHSYALTRSEEKPAP